MSSASRNRPEEWASQALQILDSADIDATQIHDLCQADTFCWLDLEDPDRDLLQAVGKALHLHPLALEDTEEFDQRPKADTHADQLLLVYFGAQITAGVPRPVEVHLHISRRFLLTVHRSPCPRLKAMREQFGDDPPDGEQMLVYRIIDSLTDSVLEVLDRVAGYVDELEGTVFRRPRARDRDRMASLRRALESFRRVMVVQRQVFERVVNRLADISPVEQSLAPYYDDVSDHLWRAVDDIEAARETLQGMLEHYTNSVQERLTIVATIFLPLTVVTGFFGMNFNWLVNHIGSVWTFWGLGIGGMLVSCIVILLWLIRSGLYAPPGR